MRKNDNVLPQDDNIFDFSEAADFLRVSHPTLYRWLSEGKIRAFKAGKQWRFYREDLADFIQVTDTGEPDEYRILREFFSQRIKAGPDMKFSKETDEKEVLHLMLRDALSKGASDIHLNPNRRGEYEVYYRMDGTLRKITDLSERISPLIKEEIKKIFDVHAARGRLMMNNPGIDVRLCVMETLAGEKYTMKFLDISDLPGELEHCINSEEDLLKIRGMLKQSRGLLLVAESLASTGTDLIYSMLNEKTESALNLVTLEEHPKYVLDGVHQIEFLPGRGEGYDEAFALLMDSDPDVIMFDRVNDEITEFCMESAARHLVIASMRARNPSNALQRLFDMGATHHSLASVLTGIICTGLLRKVCLHCAEEYIPEREMMENFSIPFDRGTIFFKARGCEKCNAGYRGHTFIHEIFEMDQEFREMLLRKGFLGDIRERSIKKGMRSFYQQAVELVLKKITTLEEAIRLGGLSSKGASMVY